MRVAVVGHVEWCEFLRVERVPEPGVIAHAHDRWEEAAGGGAVAAVQLAKLAGGAAFFTSLGLDDLGRAARKQLEEQGLTLHVGSDARPTRRAVVFVDEQGERTITVIGPKLQPSGEDGALPWEELAGFDAVYFTGGDGAALRAARKARVLVSTARELPFLRTAVVELDAIVGSGNDDGERYRPGDLEPPPRLAVTTAGPLGGWAQPGGPFRAAEVPGPVVDAYGCGDAFAAGLTYALGAGYETHAALELAARCGAAALAGRGPYPGQLTAP